MGIIIFITSCENGPTKIGSDLLPGSDFVAIHSTDSLSVWSYTMYNGTVPTSNTTVGFVGTIQDPYFGTTTAEFVSQLRLGSAWDFGPVTVDSVKLYLKLIAVKGGTEEGNHTLNIAEIADEIYIDSTYYSDTQPNTTGYEIHAQLPVLRSDTINNVAVNLPVEVGEYLIRDTSKLFYSNTKPDFRSWFKGIYFRMEPSADPLLIGFSLPSTVSSGGTYNNFFVLYMHDTAYYSRKYYFILDPVHPNACYNRFSRDFSTADPDKKIKHINDISYRDTLSYLQYLDGVYTKIVFPGLDSLKKIFSGSHVSVNKARISVPAYYDGDRFTASTLPSSLRLRYTYSDGNKYDVPDYNLDSNHSFFDGKLHTQDSTYYFNIPTFIQLFLENKTNVYKPELELWQGPTDIKSVILRANASRTPVKIVLVYTRY